VTGLLRGGRNAIGVTLAPGWYSGNVGVFGPNQYGERPWLRAELAVTYDDGTSERIVTDPSWCSGTGPVVTSDLLMGEWYDARAETPGWSGPGFDDGSWQSVIVNDGATARPVAQADAPTRVERELTPVKVGPLWPPTPTPSRAAAGPRPTNPGSPSTVSGTWR
jgi:alpha-L-rhamnosidase